MSIACNLSMTTILACITWGCSSKNGGETPVFAVAVTLAGNGTGTVTSSPSGINCGTACSANFNAGTSVTLTAAPAVSSTFSGFSGDCSGATCSLTVGAAKSATASFVKMHTLTVTATGSGSGSISSNTTPAISCSAVAGATSGTCTVQLPEGTAVMLTPTANSGSRLGVWSNACPGTSCSFTLNSDVTASASFIKTWDVSVTRACSCAGTVAFGAGSSCTSR